MSLSRKTIPILIWVVAIIGLIATGTIAYLSLQEDRFQALEYKEVSVKTVTPGGTVKIPQVPGYEAPSVMVGQSVPLFFRQCSLVDEEFEIIFDTEFIHHATGLIYPVAVQGEGVVTPGCNQIRVDVPMPDNMVRDIMSQTQDVGDEWSFDGHVQPTLSSAEVTDFRSERFVVVREVEQ